MAKSRSPVIDDVVDESPALGASAPVAVADPPEPDAFPWGFMVKHPGYGALRVKRDEASTPEEAVEVYRRRKCPHMTSAALMASGIRASVLAFIPADTERGR